MSYALIAILAIGALALAFFILQAVLQITAELLQAIGRAIAYPFRAVPDWRKRRAALAALKAQQQRIERQQKQRDAESEEADSYRRRHPVRIVGAPDQTLVNKIASLLDQFVAAANSFRPIFDPLVVDTRFRNIKYMPLDFARSCEQEIDAPVECAMTPDDIIIAPGASIKRAYGAVDVTQFPVGRPAVVFDVSAAPKRPSGSLPQSNVRLVGVNDATPVDITSDMARRAYASELKKIAEVVQSIKLLEGKLQAANEAYELMEIHLAHQSLLARQFANTIAQEYDACSRRYQADANADLAPIKEAWQNYQARTKTGIEKHFDLAQRLLRLPIPPDYPWTILYDPKDRILQIDQRVPSLGDIVVKRADSKRPIAKRDADDFLRKILPAIALHIAQHAARNDLEDDVDTIAVNGWTRFFEKKSGKLKDAYVITLKVARAAILEIDINKADALLAFRNVGGVFVYNPQEIVPIDPQIRLDKEDKRFVEGREVLSGLVQGQNLAAMDWQDFEHLIRELLSKEYARDGAEVRITRASRDQGVDAIIFDPDPLRGGKYVVQAKRYSAVVELSAVRDLWGTVMNEGASRGILVTTSWFGRDAYDWTANKPITLIDGQNLLALLTKHGYRFAINKTP